jgi:tetratricopeptide (TPR) repeat protein
MTRMPNRALMWIANLLLPGAGLVLLGRIGMGMVWAVLWGSAAAWLLLGLAWPDGTGGASVFARGAAAVAFYVGGQGALYATRRRAERYLASEARDGEFRAALVAYLQGKFDESESICRALLREDPDDVEATLQLGYIARQRGDPAAARRWFVRARYLDDVGKWDFEIERELAACV